MHMPQMTPLRACLTLVALGLALRYLLLGGHPPVSYPDSSTYLQAARDLLSGDFSTGMGRRTPGYPAVVALIGVDAPKALMLFNMACGLLISLLLFAVAWMLTGSVGLSFVAGLSYDLNLQQIYQETVLLTETLSTLSVLAVVALALHLLRRDQGLNGHHPQNPAWGLLSLLAAYAVLVRPQFIYFVPLLPLLAILATSGLHMPSASALRKALWVLVPLVAVILSWCAVLQAKTGNFTLSTQSGFGLSNHAINYFEEASDHYAGLRDVLVKTRDERVREAGHARNTVWYAWPEIQRVTGWTLPETSRQLQGMCKELFLRFPARYLRSVASAWVDFWTVPIFWKPELLQPGAVADALQALWWVEHKFLRLANVLFVLAAVGALISKGLRRRWEWDLAMTAIMLVVLCASIVQALFDQGASSRYALPTQALVVVTLMVLWQRWRQPKQSPRDLLTECSKSGLQP